MWDMVVVMRMWKSLGEWVGGWVGFANIPQCEHTTCWMGHDVARLRTP
jgi:hypothetical protein